MNESGAAFAVLGYCSAGIRGGANVVKPRVPSSDRGGATLPISMTINRVEHAVTLDGDKLTTDVVLAIFSYT